MKRLFYAVSLIALATSNIAVAGTCATEVDIIVQSSSSWDGEALPAYPAGQPEVTILKITIPKGTQLPVHEHPVINAGVLLAGELAVKTEDGDVLHLQAGDPIVEVVDKWHYGINEGNEPVEIIVFYAGIKDMPITIQE